MILLIDNYDSFVHNLARYFQRLGQETRVVRNDMLSVEDIRRLQPDAIVLSPGPCTPSEAGCSLEVVRQLTGAVPILGVCLGHQTIAAALGGKVVRAKEPVHGRSSLVRHIGEGLFAGLPNPLTVGRYHSLVVEEKSLPPELVVTARTDDGVIMALAHRQHPVVGVQFHPESILTCGGYEILANFLRLAKLSTPKNLPSFATEGPIDEAVQSVLPSRPITF
ncbi:MAG: aminodeoxychorismate/anthranilate synthase component II [Planctomycetales bacterium]|nr:aminodeoxychorismate/anthranilate synthase component II [Planctomycetales bacterium]